MSGLPTDEGIVTSAAFGHGAIVQIHYRTDADGKPVEDDQGNLVEGYFDYPCTYHGPFDSLEQAQEWMDAYPDGDTDIIDMQAMVLNFVRPTDGEGS